MRILTFILTVAVCLFLMNGGGAILAQDAPSSFAVNVMAGGTMDNFELKTDSLGYGAGIQITLSKNLGFVGFYDNTPTESHVATYGAVTLFDWKFIGFSALVGAEWEAGKIVDFAASDPTMSVGVLGGISLPGNFGGYGALTTPTDSFDDFDNYSGRLGLKYRIF